MARWLNEEMVKKLEEQRALRDRAAAAGFTVGMTEQERQNQVFKKAKEEAIERRRMNILANPNAETNTALRHSVMRNEEIRQAREQEMEKLGKELATREEEARQRRYGMEGQGKEAALANKEAAIRAAELQTASAQKIAGINAASAEKIAGINTASAEKINKEKMDTEYGRTELMTEGQVQAEEVKANAAAAQEYAQNLMRTRQLDEKTALAFSQRAIQQARQMVNQSKRRGRPTMTFEQAIEKVHQQNKEYGRLPGTASKWEVE